MGPVEGLLRLFEDELQRALGQKRFKIVVSCTELAYIASAGLGAIMGAIEEIRENGGDLRLAGTNTVALFRSSSLERRL
mgnify:CR=1 FL=1